MFSFLFLIVFKNFFTIPEVIENVKLQLAPTIPIIVRTPMIVANDTKKLLPDNIDKSFNDLSK